MTIRIALLALALGLAACNQQSGTQESADGAAPQLDAPAPESEPSRSFTAGNDAARSASGNLTVSVATQLPDDANADAQEVITLRGANGLSVQGQITGAVSPATQVGGQTLRALLAIPVEEPQVLVYRVTNETKANNAGICGADTAQFVVVWEPAGPGEPVMKVLGVTGAAPGAANSRPCTMLEYRRS